MCQGTEWLPGGPPCPSLSSPPIAIASAPRRLTFVFEAPNAVGKFGEAGDPGILLLEFSQGTCWRAPHGLPGADNLPGWNPRLGAEDCAILNTAMVSNADLASGDHSLAQACCCRRHRSERRSPNARQSGHCAQFAPSCRF